MKRKITVLFIIMALVSLPVFSSPLVTDLNKSQTDDERCKKIRSRIDALTNDKGFFAGARKIGNAFSGGDDITTLKNELMTKDKYGSYPIFYPVKNYDVDLTKRVLQYMDRIDTIYNGSKNESLLLCASDDEGDRTEILDLLLEKNPSLVYINHSVENDGWTALCNAVFMGNRNIAKKLLNKGADPNIVAKAIGFTPLRFAFDKDAYPTQDDRLDMVQALVERGADVNCVWEWDTQKFKDTPLYWAIVNGDTAIMQFLIAKGADVNAEVSWKDDEGGDYTRPVLHSAYYTNNKDVFTILLEHKADVNKQNSNGDTLLHLVAKKGDYKIYRLLKDTYKGDAGIANKEGKAPYELLDKFDKTVADTLRRYYEMQEYDASAKTKLQELVSGIQAADINQRTSDGSGLTVLQVALANKDEDTAQQLLKKGADYRLLDSSGDNALDYAIQKNLQKTINYLVDEKGKSSMSKYSLFYAMEQPDQSNALLLLKNGADYKGTRKEVNALEYAIEHNLREVVTVLLGKPDALGAKSLFKAIDKDLRDNTDYVRQVLKKDRVVLAAFDKELNSTVNAILYAATRYPENGTYPFEQRKSIIMALKEKGCSLDEKISSGEHSGETALFYAVKHNDYEFAHFVIESGADVGVSQKGAYAGRTPIFYALENRNSQIVSLLLKKQGDAVVDIRLSNSEDKNATLLMFFARYGSSETLKSILPKMLAKNSRILDTKDSQGRTPFMYAAQYNDEKVMAILRIYGCDVFATDNDGQNALDISVSAGSSNTERLKSYGL